MPLKAGDRAAEPTFEAFDGGFTWIAHPDEGMQRASHALSTDDGVWVVDPVDAAGLDGRLRDLGTVAGVVVLLDRHERDAAAVARRHDVPVVFPEGVSRDVDAPVESASGRVPGTDFRIIDVVDWPGWHEVGIFDGETLVLAEALGTADYFCVGEERLGVHPMTRLAPPRHLAEFAPERVLVGHGRGVHEAASRALDDALSGARRDLPRAWLGALASLL